MKGMKEELDRLGIGDETCRIQKSSKRNRGCYGEKEGEEKRKVDGRVCEGGPRKSGEGRDREKRRSDKCVFLGSKELVREGKKLFGIALLIPTY